MKKLLLIPFLLIPSAFAQDLLAELIETNEEAKEIDWMLVPGKELRGYFGKRIAGVYARDTKTAALNQSLKPAQLRNTFYHELCHHLWWHELSDEDRDAYAELWYWEREAPTAYSKVNMTENFAEMCRISKYDQWMGVTRTAIPRIKSSNQYLFFQ